MPKVIPTRTLDSNTLVGHALIGVRQRVDGTKQITGVSPTITGPPAIRPWDGVMFNKDLYTYADIQSECLVGDSANINAQVILKALDETVDAQKMTVTVAESTAASVTVVGRVIRINFVPGVTTYANINAMLGAHPDLPLSLAFILPGTGAPNVFAQDKLYFKQPALTQAVQDDGGIFRFAETERCYTLQAISLVCGAGSTVDAYIQDAGGGHPRKILAGVSGVADDHQIDLPLLSNEEVLIEETVSGGPAPGTDKYITLYLVNTNSS